MKIRKYFLGLILLASSSWAAVQFNGSTTFVAAPYPAGITYPNTLSCWVKLTSPLVLNSNPVIISLNNPNSLNEEWLDYLGNAGPVYQMRIISQGATRCDGFTTFQNDTNWHFLVGVFNSANSNALYFDGAVSSAPTCSGVSAPTGISSVTVGGFYYNVTNFYTGPPAFQVDDARVYQRALSAQEITILFNSKASLYMNQVPVVWWKLNDGNPTVTISTGAVIQNYGSGGAAQNGKFLQGSGTFPPSFLVSQ